VSVPERVPPLPLARRRDLGELLGLTFSLARRWAAVFLSLSLLVVTPVVLIVDGIWGRALADGVDADRPVAAQLVSGLLLASAVPALITALHVAVVQGLARGEAPTVGGALAQARPRFLPALGAVLLYGVVVAIGLVFFIVPGVFLGVLFYFAAQAAVVDGLAPVGALRRSAELVRGGWWRTFGLLLVAGLVFTFIAVLLGGIGGALAGDDGVIFVVVQILVQAVVLSLTALFGTLLFFDLRTRKDLPWQGLRPVDPAAPERPDAGLS